MGLVTDFSIGYFGVLEEIENASDRFMRLRATQREVREQVHQCFSTLIVQPFRDTECDADSLRAMQLAVGSAETEIPRMRSLENTDAFRADWALLGLTGEKPSEAAQRIVALMEKTINQNPHATKVLEGRAGNIQRG